MASTAAHTRLAAIAPESLHTLIDALREREGEQAAIALQDAGYATGIALATAMHAWLRERNEGAPSSLPLGLFAERASAFLQAQGWGGLTIDTMGSVATTVTTRDWAERAPRGDGDAPNNHFTTGLLAGFFGALANAPLAVLEVDPAGDAGDAGDAPRFLLGSEAVITHVFTRLQDGEAPEVALSSLA